MTGTVYVAGQRLKDREGELWLVVVGGLEPTLRHVTDDGQVGVDCEISWVESNFGRLTPAEGGAS